MNRHKQTARGTALVQLSSTATFSGPSLHLGWRFCRYSIFSVIMSLSIMSLSIMSLSTLVVWLVGWLLMTGTGDSSLAGGVNAVNYCTHFQKRGKS